MSNHWGLNLDSTKIQNPIWHFFKEFGPLAAICGFIIISGYSVSNSYSRQSSKFLVRRIAKIIPTYYFWTILVFIIFLFPNFGLDFSASKIDYSLSGIFSLFFLGIVAQQTILGHTWSLAVEFWFYLFIPILKKFNLLYLLILFVASGLVFFFANRLGIERLPDSKRGISLVVLFWCFVVGIIYEKFENKIKMWILILLSLSIFIIFSKWNYEFGTLSFLTLGVVISGILFYKVINISNLYKKIFTYLGEISYSIFIVHIPIIIILDHMFNIKLNYLTYIITSILIAIISYHAIELQFKKIILNNSYIQNIEKYLYIGAPLLFIITLISSVIK